MSAVEVTVNRHPSPVRLRRPGILSTILALSVLAVPALAARSDDSPVASTTAGPVTGVHADGLDVFRSIPYAAPPTKDLRWRPPRPVEPWTEPLDATDPGPICPQTSDILETTDVPQSEDCLTVNVWTPGLQGHRPVLVWLHGGGFSWGSARDEWYDGAQLSRRGDLVVVTVQYRLGALGWLDLGGVSAEYAGSGNNGLRDQIAALRWVQANAGAFGGDPEQVTVMGESAGAISIGSLLATPEASGLFDRVIMQSGATGLVADREWAGNVTGEYMRILGVEDLAGLRRASTAELLDAAEELYGTQFADTAFHPVVDGAVLAEPPLHTIAGGTARVPVLIGTMLDEARLWIFYMDELERLPLEYARPWLQDLTDGRADEVVGVYRKSRPDYTDPQLGLAIVGDVAFRMPAVRLAETLVADDVPVWMYLFALQSPVEDGRYGAAHSFELPFTFHNLDAKGVDDLIGADPAYEKLADRIQDSWIAFARSGDPNTPGLPAWPMYDTSGRPTMILDRKPHVEEDPLAAEREVWRDIPFDGTDPDLAHLSPAQFEGTRITPGVFIAVVGPGPLIGAGMVLVVLIVGVTFGIRALLRRRRRGAQS